MNTYEPLESSAQALGEAEDSMGRASAMTKLAHGNLNAGNTALAEAWAERALITLDILSEQDPSSESIYLAAEDVWPAYWLAIDGANNVNHPGRLWALDLWRRAMAVLEPDSEE